MTNDETTLTFALNLPEEALDEHNQDAYKKTITADLKAQAQGDGLKVIGAPAFVITHHADHVRIAGSVRARRPS